MGWSSLTFLYLFLVFFLILCILLFTKVEIKEGFTQNERFIVKRKEDIYDNYYSPIYKILHEPEKNADFITDIVIKDTLANKKTSVVLIIGCETGVLANQLQEKGIDTYIIDESKDMIKNALLQYPHLKTKKGNIMDPMIYDKSTFSHILCTGWRLYYIQDKISFFRHVYQWLNSGGYFIIQLKDRDKFNTIISGGRSQILNSPQNYSKKRITETNIHFGSFQYQSKYNFDHVNNDNIVTMIENFTDVKNNHVRQNEHTFYMEPLTTILDQLRYCGFIIKGQYELKEEEHQFIYIVERPN